MPVPDPGSGHNRWNIDFLFADQKAMPTFVECKRFNDTASRRSVVGQMMESAWCSSWRQTCRLIAGQRRPSPMSYTAPTGSV
jgi:hypothetical protein